MPLQELKLQQVQDELKQNKALADKDELPEWDLLSNQWSVTSNELTKKDQEIKVCFSIALGPVEVQ